MTYLRQPMGGDTPLPLLMAFAAVAAATAMRVERNIFLLLRIEKKIDLIEGARNCEGRTKMRALLNFVIQEKSIFSFFPPRVPEWQRYYCKSAHLRIDYWCQLRCRILFPTAATQPYLEMHHHHHRLHSYRPPKISTSTTTLIIVVNILVVQVSRGLPLFFFHNDTPPNRNPSPQQNKYAHSHH